MTHHPWWRGTRGEWYVVAQVVLLGLLGLAPLLPVGLPAWPARLALVGRVLGLGLGAAGGLMALAGLLRLGPNLSPLPHPTRNAALVQTGVYGLVRHPIYSGLILGAFGWALLTASSLALLLAAGLFVFFDVKARREERALRARFPEYAGYQKRVRKFIPYVY